jgi:excisionase family DNA binding protein
VFDIISQIEAQEDFLSVKELCSLLSISRSSLNRLIVNSEIPSLMIGGQRKFNPGSIKRWLIRKSPELRDSLRESVKTA